VASNFVAKNAGFDILVGSNQYWHGMFGFMKDALVLNDYVSLSCCTLAIHPGIRETNLGI